MNTLYYGDNLEILRKYVKDESVDLIYLDPPFNSQRAYNIIFPDKTGKLSRAQIQAFEDTWFWGEESQQAFDDIMRGSYSLELKDMMKAFREFMGTSNLMAYLTMMAVRLVEMHRVLKMTGSLYLHCDPTASHYLKVLLDQVFGITNFRNEIIWQRTNAHNNPAKRFCRVNDNILFYSRTAKATWKTLKTDYSPEQLSRYKPDENGRLCTGQDLTITHKAESKNRFEWRGAIPPVGRAWGYSRERLEELWAEGKILKKLDGTPRLDGLKVYLDEKEGKAVGTIWHDIGRVGNTSGERLGYPTQKPVTLLERIIQASSNEGDVVMDPFCGCGTAVVAAEKLGRKWIGIDITHLAISLIKKRITDHFPDAKFQVVGEPRSLDDAQALFKQSAFQFESWAVSLIGGQPYKSSGGGDTGMDGFLYFQDFQGNYHRIIIEVKGGGYQPKDVRSLAHVLQREGSPMGILIALEPPTRGMLSAAAELGKWAVPGRRKSYPVLQIMTIQDFFDGKKPELPDTSETLKKAKREVREREKKKNQPKLGLEE
ncbi:MAG: site-specific DNA-methyltransferase [candidate division Zixibacteria bacterium]|jgi:site-specific DNA-methyltransferase (adenine-specific)|nr:site-specific DNA-methyltransferase [candidate division Zixibacteria bacterium]